VITFKTFFESNKPLGLIETITIKEIGPIEAKVDSGNGAYNVLHGINLQYSGLSDDYDGKSHVTFDTVDGKSIKKPVVELIDINIGSGNIEERPVVEFDIEIGDKLYPKTKFSIGDRKENDYKILVGKDFIEQLGGIIDVSAEGNLD
tara:strand:+ start:14833 stop:15273 length:441 start_codon:yes stop_codon:yes gene_type:complete